MNTLIVATCVAVLAQVAPDPAAGQAADSVKVDSVWDFIVKGGPMMIPIILCSMIAMTVVVERLISLSRRNVIPPDFLTKLNKTLEDDAKNRSDAVDYCLRDGSHIARIFADAIKRFGEPVELLEKHIAEAGQREVLKLRKYFRLLMVIAAIAPLMGLLGTIFGMIAAFQTVAGSGEALGKTELLAEGIYEAMITTAAGLLLAIPVLIAYHGLSAKVEGLVAEMDRMTVEFIEEHAAPVPAVVARPAAQPPGDNGDDAADTPVLVAADAREVKNV